MRARVQATSQAHVRSVEGFLRWLRAPVAYALEGGAAAPNGGAAASSSSAAEASGAPLGPLLDGARVALQLAVAVRRLSVQLLRCDYATIASASGARPSGAFRC